MDGSHELDGTDANRLEELGLDANLDIPEAVKATQMKEGLPGQEPIHRVYLGLYTREGPDHCCGLKNETSSKEGESDKMATKYKFEG